jgi:hypothetical protein
MDIYNDMSAEAKMFIQDMLLEITDVYGASVDEINFVEHARQEPVQFKNYFNSFCEFVDERIAAIRTQDRSQFAGQMIEHRIEEK